jgi:hypothetical protein
MTEWGAVRIGRTYHDKGFFNETSTTPKFPRPNNLRESIIVLECVGSRTSISIEAKVRYRNADGSGGWINKTQAARIYGNKPLADWFQENVVMDEEVSIAVIEPLRRYRIASSMAANNEAPGSSPMTRTPEARRFPEETSSPIDMTPTTGRALDRTVDVVPPSGEMTSTKFENLARSVMGELLGAPLSKGKVPDTPKHFDMVSSDGSMIGDAKYFTMVRGRELPPAKFSVIAEHVWLLEKTRAPRKFLVFGNDIRVPTEWLKRYGPLVSDVEFYFLDAFTRKVTRLHPR